MMSTRKMMNDVMVYSEEVNENIKKRKHQRNTKERKARIIKRALIAIILAAICGSLAGYVVGTIITKDEIEVVEKTITNNNTTYVYSDKIKVSEDESLIIENDNTNFIPVEITEWDKITSGLEDQTSKDFHRFLCIALSEYGPEGVNGINPALLYSIAAKESSFNPKAVSADGHDKGLCQIRDINYDYLDTVFGRDFNEYDAEDSLMAAAYMLNGYLEEYGDVHKALMCYNNGETGASNLWEKGIYETEYSKAIVNIMETYEAEGLFW